MNKLLKLNVGCGETKHEDFINIDAEVKTKPDIVCDLRFTALPFKDNSADTIYCIHSIEHVELKYWNRFFVEFFRVLVSNGQLVLAYPEFEKCARNFLENYRGLKDFFRNTLYGRQLYPGDYHVTPCVTEDIIRILREWGFRQFSYGPDPACEWYTFIQCFKGDLPVTREDVLRKEIFNVSV